MVMSMKLCLHNFVEEISEKMLLAESCRHLFAEMEYCIFFSVQFLLLIVTI
jgi:hypothetical protein